MKKKSAIVGTYVCEKGYKKSKPAKKEKSIYNSYTKKELIEHIEAFEGSAY